jgi:hypothetical protein
MGAGVVRISASIADKGASENSEEFCCFLPQVMA